MYELKALSRDAIPEALSKVERYRLLNEPAEAESICRDVLAVQSDHQLGLRVLGLALTDQFEPSSGARFAEAQQVFARLADPFERAFYDGIACERQAKAQLAGRLPPHSARPLFDQALARYAEAETLRPAGNDDPILRWNSCVRALQRLGVEEGEARVEWEGDFVPHRR